MKATPLVFAFAVALSLALVLLLDPAESCNYVNAYDLGGNIDQGDYITITGTSACHPDCGEFNHPCLAETLYTCYAVTVDSLSCQPFGAGPTGCVQGNNLSGHYQVSVKTGSCLKLCACSG